MAGHDVNDERHRTADVEFDRSLQFSKMFLSDAVVHGLSRNNFVHPSPIQARAIPLAKLGLDLLVQAKSGTGKTLVFAVQIAEAHNPDVTFPQSLTIVPTREIAVQIETVLNTVGYSVPNFRAKSFIGGMDVSQDRKNLQSCSAVVGTPGRINHLIKSNVLNTSQMKILVLDEADSLIAGTLKPDVDQIVKALSQKRQTIVCSATYYNNRDRELLKYLNDKFIGVTPKKEVPVLHGIRQFVRELPETKDNIKEMMAKIAELNQILKKVPYSQVLLFANTQSKAETYCSYLNRAGWPAEVIRGGQEQRVRLKTVENLKQFRCRVLTATDVIARGIDAENVNVVINVDVPKDNSIYLHRIGRAGRFGTQAIAITLVSSAKELERFRKILFDIGGNEMYVYRLPKESTEEIWNFDQYGDKYEKFYASKLEQEIRDQGADRLLLETIQEVDSKTELERKSAENLNDSLEDATPRKVDSVPEVDSIEQLAASRQANVEPQTVVVQGEQKEEEEEIVQRIIPLEEPEQVEEAATEDIVPVASKAKNIDDMFLAAMQQVDQEQSAEDGEKDAVPKPEQVEPTSNVDQMVLAAMEKLELDGQIPSSNEAEVKPEVKVDEDVVDKMFLEAMNKVDLDKTGNDEEQKLPEVPKEDPVDQLFLDAMKKLDSEESSDQRPLSTNGEDASELDQLFLAAMAKLESEEISDELQTTSPESPELSCSTPESCYTTDSSFSSNATKKVEVGSNFTTPNARVHEIRGAAPDHQISSSSSDNSSDHSHRSDPVVPAEQNCLPLEVNNDALFAKIMEQKELEADQQRRPFQFSIDGCSLEVHDDPISDRDINSRKGSVPDVVPCGITLDPSRLQNNYPSVEEEQDETATFDLNSNTCGSNRGSVFEPEEEEEPIPSHQDRGGVRPKRIRFRDDENPLDLQSVSVEPIAGPSHQQGGPPEQPEADPLALPPIPDTVAATQEADDASSYSSQYDSESSNSSFFDQREWESSEVPKPKTTEEGDEAAAVEPEEGEPSQSAEAKRSKSKTARCKRSKNATNLYHRTYAGWTNHYWNQTTMIRDYVRFSAHARHNGFGQ